MFVRSMMSDVLKHSHAQLLRKHEMRVGAAGGV